MLNSFHEKEKLILNHPMLTPPPADLSDRAGSDILRISKRCVIQRFRRRWAFERLSNTYRANDR